MSPDELPSRPRPPLLLLLGAAVAAAAPPQFLRKVERCKRPEGAVPVLEGAASLDATFELLADPHGPFENLDPEVVSKDPWIVVFNRFLSEAEVATYDSFMFGGDHNFQASPAGANKMSRDRHSETAFCTGSCDKEEIVQRLRHRASNVTGAPPSHFDFTQAVRYKAGMFFHQHHDNHRSFHLLPCGSRIFTLFVYLKSPEKGGETSFHRLGISVPPKAGAAVLWANTKADEDMNRYNDERVEHASLEVTEGEKHGLNLWAYQYEYRSAWKKSCVSIDFAEQLDAYLKGEQIPKDLARPGASQCQLELKNSLRTEVHAFWQDGVREVYMDIIPPRGSQNWNTFAKHVWIVRDSPQPGKGALLKRIVIGDRALERHELTDAKEDL